MNKLAVAIKRFIQPTNSSTIVSQNLNQMMNTAMSNFMRMGGGGGTVRSLEATRPFPASTSAGASAVTKSNVAPKPVPSSGYTSDGLRIPTPVAGQWDPAGAAEIARKLRANKDWKVDVAGHAKNSTNPNIASTHNFEIRSGGDIYPLRGQSIDSLRNSWAANPVMKVHPDSSATMATVLIHDRKLNNINKGQRDYTGDPHEKHLHVDFERYTPQQYKEYLSKQKNK